MATMDEVPVSEELKEFEREYIEREKDNIVCVYDRHAGLVDGAKWQKEQMMAKAIDTTIKQGCTDLGIFIKRLDKTKFNFGDKVKVIVIKE